MEQAEPVVVLVVEDEGLIQNLIEEALIEGGFNLVCVGSGEDALDHLERGGYRALVTDINLPGKVDGWHVAKRAREIDPKMPVIYTTGASDDQWPSQGVPQSILLTKPFAPAQIVTAVSNLLNQTPPVGPPHE